MIAAHPDIQRPPHQHSTARKLHLGSGEQYRDGWVNVDINPDVKTDLQMDVTDTPWTRFDDGQFDQIDAHHLFEHFDRSTLSAVLRECGRVLTEGGLLRVTMPFGTNYRTDDDHETQWTWESPTQYSRPHQRHWDPDVPFTLVDRRVRGWFVRPFGVLNPVYRAAARFRPGLWATELPLTGGELTAVYRRVSDED